MPIADINHYFVRANDLKATRDFYVNVLGFEEMPRPNFPFPGYWLGVPLALASCHTAEVGGYAIEGHVPADDVRRLLAERPTGARGLAVPGMVPGSPGMDGPRTAYTTLLFDARGGTRPFARH